MKLLLKVIKCKLVIGMCSILIIAWGSRFTERKYTQQDFTQPTLYCIRGNISFYSYYAKFSTGSKVYQSHVHKLLCT